MKRRSFLAAITGLAVLPFVVMKKLALKEPVDEDVLLKSVRQWAPDWYVIIRTSPECPKLLVVYLDHFSLSFSDRGLTTNFAVPADYRFKNHWEREKKIHAWTKQALRRVRKVGLYEPDDSPVPVMT